MAPPDPSQSLVDAALHAERQGATAAARQALIAEPVVVIEYCG